MSQIRINKYLANLGFASRRNISQYLKDHVLLVDKKRIDKPGTRIDPEKNEIILDGKKLKNNINYTYILLNKPKGIISSVKDEFGRKTVVDLVKAGERVYPVGRLDQDTTGLILLTNDGELTQKLTHPSSHVPKTYLATVSGQVPKTKINILRKGVKLKDGITAPAEAEIVDDHPNQLKADQPLAGVGGPLAQKRSVIKLTIYEGRNHQIKRMLATLRIDLISLKRVAIGEMDLGDLKIGEWRELSKEEVAKISNL
jgi:23S rRNA pseudouridine2605 synthase